MKKMPSLRQEIKLVIKSAAKSYFPEGLLASFEVFSENYSFSQSLSGRREPFNYEHIIKFILLTGKRSSFGGERKAFEL